MRAAAPRQTTVRQLDGDAMLNPIRSEDEAFRFLVYIVALAITVAVIVLVVRAL